MEIRWFPGFPRTLVPGEEWGLRGRHSGCQALVPSAYHTSAFLLEGVLVLRDAFEKRVVSCLGLHIIFDLLSCLGNL